MDVYYYDRYIDEKIDHAKRILELKDFYKYSSIIFLPYVDRQFNKIINLSGIIWDIWCQIEGNNVVRNSKDIEIENKSNLLYFNNNK